MARRKWIVRGLVFAILAGLGYAAWMYQRLTNPSAVRQQVLGQLQALFPGAAASLDSARLRILGGIVLTELRLSRRDDPDRSEVLHVPTAVLYHDKEKLLDGTLRIRKVELQRPRLRLVRCPDGTWNIDGLGAAHKDQQLLPTIVIHDGTLVLDDRQGCSTLPNLEIHNVSLTLLNDPLPTIVLDGAAVSETLGTLRLTGTWDRSTREIKIAAQAQGIALNSALVQRIAGTCPDTKIQPMHLEGKADIRADIVFHPGAPQLITYEVRCQVKDGKIQHPLLALPLEDVAATVLLANGQVRLERLDARSGMTLVQAQGSGLLPCPENDCEISVAIRHLKLSDKLYENLPKKIQNLYDLFQPAGMVGLRVECARRAGQWVKLASGADSRLVLLPENLHFTFRKFPYPVERLTGTIEYNLLSQVTTLDAKAFTGTQPIALKGFWKGAGPASEAAFHILANEVPIDEKLLGALPGPMQNLARSFQPAGKLDLDAHIRHVPGTPLDKFHQEYHAALKDLSVCWKEFPYPVANLNGVLDITPQSWVIRGVKARGNGGEIFLEAQSTTAPDDPGQKGMSAKISARNLALDDALRKALTPLPLQGLGRAWDTFVPAGHLDIQLAIAKTPGPPAPEASLFQGLTLEGKCAGGTLTPAFLPYSLEGVGGEFRYHQGRLDVANVTARHQTSMVYLDNAKVDFHPQGGHYAVLERLRVYRLYLDESLCKALPPTLGKACASLKLQDPVTLAGKLIVTQTPETNHTSTLWWDGAIGLENATLTTGVELQKVTGTLACRGLYQNRQLKGINGNFKLANLTLLKQPFHDVQGHFQVKDKAPNTVNVDIKAPLFGGDISGPLRLEFGDLLHYEMNMTASQINLQDFGRHNLGPQSHLQGMAMGRLHLQGQGSSPETIDGHGSLEIPVGRIYNLPLLLDLLKFLGLRWPDRTAFDEARANFHIHGRRVRMEHLELIGNAVSLYGQGDFQVDGSDLKLDFYPTWGRVQQMIPPALRGIPAEIGKNMLKIEMRGKVGSQADDLKFTKKPMPILLDPLFQLRDRLVIEPMLRWPDRLGAGREKRQDSDKR